MSLLLLSVHHRVHGLACVEQVQAHAAHLRAATLAAGHVRGVVELATCNRWELYLDIDSDHGATVGHALSEAMRALDVTLPVRLVHALQTDTLWHLFQVASGLDSMVLGEREIAGQVRRAVAAARQAGTLTHQLDSAFAAALRAARRVQVGTGLAATGRSIVAVALDLATMDAARPVLVVGTGNYAGAAVAALRARGAQDLRVHSISGRGAAFAQTHAMAVAEDLADGIAGAGTVVCCHGGGTVVSPALLTGARDVAVVDLALSHDVDPAVAELPGVRLIDLAAVQAAAPGLAGRELAHARAIIADGVAALTESLNNRRLAPAVAALQRAVQTTVEDELARLPQRDITPAEAAHALRRLAARLAHVPSVRAREAAREGQAEEYLQGMTALLGLDGFEITEEAWHVDPARLETDRCPVTGMAIDDLAPAMTR